MYLYIDELNIYNIGRKHVGQPVKVRNMTPKVAKNENKKRIPSGRAGKRVKCLYIYYDTKIRNI